MNKKEIIKQLNEWWNEEIPECKNKNYCDLCCNCFQNLCNRLGCKLEDGLKIKENNQQPDVKVLSVTGGEGKQTGDNRVMANLRQDDDTSSLTSPADVHCQGIKTDTGRGSTNSVHLKLDNTPDTQKLNYRRLKKCKTKNN